MFELTKEMLELAINQSAYNIKAMARRAGPSMGNDETRKRNEWKKGPKYHVAAYIMLEVSRMIRLSIYFEEQDVTFPKNQWKQTNQYWTWVHRDLQLRRYHLGWWPAVTWIVHQGIGQSRSEGWYLHRSWIWREMWIQWAEPPNKTTYWLMIVLSTRDESRVHVYK